MKFSWKQLSKPFTVLAPMEDVTDTVFRQIVASIHKPDVMMTEFVSVEGLCSQGRPVLHPKLAFSDAERPLVAQIWGIKPDNFYRVARELVSMGFDGIDINMGCPQKNIMKHGGGAACIDNPKLAGTIIQAVRDGIRSVHSTIPISVKTRIGNKKRKTDEWIRFLLLQHLDALTVHGRTAKEQSEKPADWGEIQKAREIRDALKVETVIIGNGDVQSYTQLRSYCHQYGVDGIMIGRGIFHNINVFDPTGEELSSEALRKTLYAHLTLFETTYGLEFPKYTMMKKFFKMYIRDFEGSAILRSRLMETKTAFEAKEILRTFERIEAKFTTEVSQTVKV